MKAPVEGGKALYVLMEDGAEIGHINSVVSEWSIRHVYRGIVNVGFPYLSISSRAAYVFFKRLYNTEKL